MSNVQGPKRAFPKKASKDINKSKKKFRSAASNVVGTQKRLFGANGANSVIKIQRTAFPIPDVLVTKLKTSQAVLLTTAASGGINAYRLYANSCYDPMGTAGGNQPRFFDQLMALYSSFTVYGCKVGIKILRKTGGSQDNTVRVLGLPSASATMPTASLYNDANEFPYTMRFDIASANTSSGNMQSSVVSLMDRQEKKTYFDVAQFFGRSREKLMDDSSFSGSATADPSSILSYYVGIQGYEAAQTDTVLVELSMTQYVTFRTIVPVGTS